MNLAFQFLDVAIVAFVLISAVYATYRGFVAETLSIFAWVAAAFATLYFGPWTAYWVRGMVQPPWLGEVVGYAVVFIVVVLPLSFASSRFAEGVKKSQVGTLDAAMGAAFGIVRGLVIVGIAYLVFTAIVPIAEQPQWVTKTRLMPVIRVSAEVVSSLIPDQNAPRRRHEAAQTAARPPKTADSEPAPAPAPAAKPTKPSAPKHSKTTYGARDREALDRLIETSSSGKSGKP